MNLTSLYQPTVSQRELEVLNLIASEYSTKEIARELFVSFETAASHRKSLLRKFRAKNTAGLVRIAFERGIFTT